MSDGSEMDFLRTINATEDWGFMIGDMFVDLPKLPMVRAGHTKPPFDLKLPTGAVRRIISRRRQEATSDGNQ